MHHHVPLEIRWAAHRCGPYRKSVDPFSAPKPSSGLFRPLTSPTVRQPAPRKHRGRWRSSWIGVQAVLRSAQRPPLANPFLALLILRRTIMFPQLSSPQPPLETVDCPSDYGFSRQYLWLHFQHHRTPPTAARSPRPELRRHPSFTTRDQPFSETHLRQSIVVTCALRPELLLHGDSSSPVVT